MTDKQLEKLLKRHTKVQKEATKLYGLVINELGNRGGLNEENVVSCLNNTEPEQWEQLILELIEKEREKCLLL